MTQHSNRGLRFGPLGPSTVHLCVDMQRMFAEETPWHTPWMERVSPGVQALAEKSPTQTVFTRFVPLDDPEQGHGTWRRYYQRWSMMTLQTLEPELIELVPSLARLVPPAKVIDKRVYSPWLDGALYRLLQSAQINTLLITGGETDVCVLSTVLGAIDLGYRIVLIEDALCSSSDVTHDALMTVYESRYSQQVELVSLAEVMEAWCLHRSDHHRSDRP